MIGVIADDLSGAAEIGGIGWRHGLESVLSTGNGTVESADLCIVDTDSRGLEPLLAGRRAARAIERLLAHRPEWLFKKIDSVLRGNVVAEIEAVLQVVGRDRAIVVVCNPSRGRVIRDGQYRINGRPLHLTEFRTDPQLSADTSEVLRLLSRAGTREVAICTPGQTVPKTGIVMGEACTQEDLDYWARRVDENTLSVGAAEFFCTLLELNGHRVTRSKPQHTNRHVQHSLFVCGSASGSAQYFVSECRTRGLPVVTMPAELASGKGNGASKQSWIKLAIQALARHDHVILAIDKPIIPSAATANQFSRHLADVAEAVLKQIPVTHLFLEGGATAATVVSRMGWMRLRVADELAPGVVSLLPGGNPQYLVTVKPGSYVWPQATLESLAPEPEGL